MMFWTNAIPQSKGLRRITTHSQQQAPITTQQQHCQQHRNGRIARTYT
jgi:hypothetical protein